MKMSSRLWNLLGHFDVEEPYVDGCECNYAYNVEQLLWRHRGAVASYLKARVEDRLQDDAQLLSVLGKGADD